MSPTIRDGRGVLTVDSNEPRLPDGAGPVLRSIVSPQRMADIAAESVAAERAEAKGTATPATRPVGLLTEAAAANGRKAARNAKRHTPTEGARAAALAAKRSRLTARQAQVIDALRRLGSRRAVMAELGMNHVQTVDSILLDAHAKGLLPADLPDLTTRMGGNPTRYARVSPAGLTAAERRRAVAVATPPGPIAGMEPEYFAPDSPTLAEAGGGSGVILDGISLHLNIRIEAAVMAGWSPLRISNFFAGVAKVLQAYHQQAEP